MIEQPIQERSDPMKYTYAVKGLDCPHCSSEIESDLKKKDGISAAAVNLVTQTLTVDSEISASVLTDIITKAVHTHEPDVDVSLLDDIIDSSVSLGGDSGEKHTRRGDNCESCRSCQGKYAHCERCETKDVITPEHKEKRSFLKTITDDHIMKIRLISGTVIFAIGFTLTFFTVPNYITLPIIISAYIILGTDVVVKAVRNIVKGRIFDESFLMSISTIGAFIIGEYPEAAAVMLFYQLGEYIQGLAVKKSRRSIAELMDIRPDSANVRRYGNIVTVSPGEVAVGEHIIVKPGERIPLDGIVSDGSSMINTTALTGESVPRKAETGDEVLSGCINESGVLDICVTKPYGQSTAAKVLELVENAAGRKAPTENFITTFSRYYTPIVVITALLLGIIPPLFFGGEWGEWLRRCFVFLVISCPCALVISIPLSFFGGIGAASRKGILIKGSNYLEALNSTDTIIFDKTGTLTKGVFKVVNISPAIGTNKSKLLETAANAESMSNHPIARSVVSEYGKEIDKSQITEYKEISGRGISAKVGKNSVLCGNAKLMNDVNISCTKSHDTGTIIYIAENNKFLGSITIADEIKPDSKTALDSLKKAGIAKTVMLTGDKREIAEAVSNEIGIDECFAELLPSDKFDILEKLKKDKSTDKKLAFVGDGINDAPVLAAADVGIAMGALGSDAAIEAADIVLMTDEPSKVAEAIGIAGYTKKIVTQNIIAVIAVKILFLILGAFGIAGMWEAVFGDVGIMILAVLNSMRILKHNLYY